MIFESLQANLFLAVLIVLFFAVIAWVAVTARLEQDASERFSYRQPVEGRWCPNPECGGLLAYKRRRVVIGDRAYFRTELWCWRCRWVLPIHTEPDYEPRRLAREER